MGAVTRQPKLTREDGSAKLDALVSRSGSTRHIRARQSGHVTDPSCVLDPEPSSEPQAVPSVMMSTR